MPKLRIPSFGAGPLTAAVIAAFLAFSAGTAARAFTGPTKPAPAPAPHPAVQQARPQQPAARPAPGYHPAVPARPGQPGYPQSRPGTYPRPGTLPGGQQRQLPGGQQRQLPGGEHGGGLPGGEHGTLPPGDHRTIPMKPGMGEGRPGGEGFPHTVPAHNGPAFHPGPGGRFSGPHGEVGRSDPRTGRVIAMSRVNPDGSRLAYHNSPLGVRRVEQTRMEFGHPVHTVTDGHRGFVERDLRRPGLHERTYYDHGRVHAYVYRDHEYRYGRYPVYVPAYYYHPGFYGIFVAGWSGPSFSYSWASTPGYGGYGAYFAPQPVYASPNAWMADYVINANLQANYQAQQDAGADAVADGDAGQVEQQDATPQPIPQDVRDTYAQQVQATAAEQQAEAAGQQPADDATGALSPKFRVFQSYSDVEADNGGQGCALVGGDFVRREEDTPDGNKTVAVTVVTVAVPSQSHCPVNTKVRLSIDTLQDWYNNFLQAQQAGMDAMAANQGQNGFPAVADTGHVDNALGQATPDDPSAVANAIQQQSDAAKGMQASASGGGQ